MSPLGSFLLLTLIVTVAYAVFGGRAAAGGTSALRPFKILTAAYVALTCFSLILMVYYFVGMGEHGSPRVPVQQQRRITYAGYYFARDGQLLLTEAPESRRAGSRDNESAQEEQGAPQELKIIRQLLAAEPAAGDAPPVNNLASEGFTHPALGAGESLTLKPLWEKKGAWSLKYKATNRPLRFEREEGGRFVSRCVNLGEDQWLSPGDSIFIALQHGAERQFVTIRWQAGTKYSWPFTRPVNSYYYSRGTLRGAELVYDKERDLLLSELMLKEGVALSDLMKRGKEEFRKQAGSINEEWWSIFKGLTLVREVKGDDDSRVGLIMADELFQQPGLTIYKNYRGEGSPALSPRTQEVSAEIDAATVVAYGLGSRDLLKLRLTDDVFEDPIWGQVVRVGLDSPQSWPLPPTPTSDFIITTANDYIPLDGYFINIGNSAHSFYAKAKLNDALDTLTVNDGKTAESETSDDRGTPQQPPEQLARTFRLGEPVSLGDFQQGVLLKLTQEEAAYPYVGPWAAILLMLNCLAFLLTVRRQDERPKLFLCWTVAWALFLTLLTVRLLLSYRASLLPPLDASAKDILNVFDKSVNVSLQGLAGGVALALGVPLLARAWGWLSESTVLARLSGSNWPATVFAAVWAVLISGWIVAGKYLGSNQSFLGGRINIAVHLLVVLGLALLAKRALDTGWLLKALVVVVVAGSIALQILFVGDAGSVIYGISLAICVGLLLFWDSLLSWPAGLLGKAGVAAAFAAALFPLLIVGVLLTLNLFLLPYVTESEWLRSATRPVIPSTTFYRFASFTDSEEAILIARSTDREEDMGALLDNSRQDWQMLLYASHGASNYAGFGSAPLSKRGMTYPTSMADCVFSVYLLAEHGKAAALFLLLIYLALGATFVLAGWFLPDDLRHRYVPLVAVGGFFACNALYMAGANIALTVFTGQNIPLLGLYSPSDLVQGLLLVGLAGCMLLSTETDTSPTALREDHPVALWMGVSLCASLLVWLAMVGWRMAEVGGEKSYRENHDFSKATFDRIRNDLPPSDDSPGRRQNSPWELVGDRLVPKKGAPVEEIEAQYAKQFNERNDKFNPNGGLYYLEQARDAQGQSVLRVKVNDRYFRARSPFKYAPMWYGSIVAQGDHDPAFSALGGTMTVSLKDEGYPGSIDIGSALPIRANSATLLKEGGSEFCELRREGETVWLDPKLRGNLWDIYVDGRRITKGIPLSPLSVIVIERKSPKFRRNLIYLGATPPILAFTRWRNGEYRRLFPETALPLAYLIGKAADAAAQMEKDVPDADKRLKEVLPINIDVALQRTLQQRVAAYAKGNANYTPYRLLPNRLAVTVMDAFSGQVLALPSWPALNPGKSDYEGLIDKLPELTRSRFAYNHNLSNHIAGSTVKPLVFSAMATQLQPVGYDLADVTIYNRPDRYTPPAPEKPGERKPVKHPHLQIGKLKINMWDCNSADPESGMKEFLVQSRDYPEGVIGMLGMVTEAEQVRQMLRASEQPSDIDYRGRHFTLDLTKASEQTTAFTLEEQFRGGLASTRGPDVIKKTILFRGLSEVFDFDLDGGGNAWLHKVCDHFFPSFGNPRLSLEKNNYIDNIVPEPVDMAGGTFQDIRGGVISCLLGGGDCRFNNVKMAEATSRLVTGLRISSRLESNPATDDVPLPAPLNNFGWREAHLISSMKEVGEADGATAAVLQNLVRLPPQYLAIYKTGTILEGASGRESEALMFVIGRWGPTGFVRGQTLSGFLYMESSKDSDPKQPDGKMKKFNFASPILNELVKYLSQRDRNN
jgi:hypothetical protein